MMRDQEQLAQLVAEVATFLQEWQSRLADRSAIAAAESSVRAAKADLLGRRAAETGSGGLAHHLFRCSEALRSTPSNVPLLRDALRAVSEISWQLREELRLEGSRLRPFLAPASTVSLFDFRATTPRRPVLARPPVVSLRAGLPPLASGRAAPRAARPVQADLEERLQRVRPASRSHRRSSGTERRRSTPNGELRSGRRRSRVSWGVVLLITVPVGLLLGNAVLALDQHLRAHQRTPSRPSVSTAAEGRARSTSVAATPGAPQQLRTLAAQIHGLGGAESPELSALLDSEADAAYQTLAQGCAGAAACDGQRLARELLAPHQLPARAPRSEGPPSHWLAGLTIPAIGAHDDPEVQRWLEYYTGHSVGRELFQTLLFRCGAHKDLIEQRLIHHGLPLDLLAVVLTESACVSDAESAVGARGLWQFMAPTARAYHLIVQDGVVDERLSPVKSTEAAVRLLGDLYRKLGSWELAFAGYNAGSGAFRTLARLQQAGATASFWELAEARLIPEETARYVPRIQAYALILANLHRFDFSTAQVHLAEETADLQVPSRARLGQVARAAGTSVAYLRSLNPDLVGTVIPNLPGNLFVLQVPKAAAFRARETLGRFLLEQLDLCVSSTFDWGREQFTAAMQASCTARRSL